MSYERFVRVTNDLLIERLHGIIPDDSEIVHANRIKGGAIEIYFFSESAGNYQRAEGGPAMIYSPQEES